MLDLNFIKQNQKIVEKACQDKGYDPKKVDELLVLDSQRSILDVAIQSLRHQRNELTANLKAKPDEKIIQKGKQLKEQISKKEKTLEEINKKLQVLIDFIPNVSAEDVPVGREPEIVKKWGEITKPDFILKDHIQLSQDLDLIDFERASKVAGFRGYFLKNDAVLMHLGLMDLVLKKLIGKGFQPFSAPAIVKKDNFYYTGHFPWGEKEAYSLGEEEKDYALAGTAEVPMVGYHSNEILEEKDLPLKYVCFSPCFRREIGNYGKDTKGLYRLHEFLKIEQIIICKNDWQESAFWLEELLKNSEEILQDLKIPYRVCLMPTQDMGEPQVKKYDVEAWMPGRGEYGETMSDSMMGEFQARRANIKYKTKDGKKIYVHTLNNTAIASPRILIAILENYQQKDGSVKIPKVLQKYLGKDVIKPPFQSS